MIADKLKHSEIKTENDSDKLIVEKVFSNKQEHVFRWWNDLTIKEQENLLNQLRLIDFTLLQDLVEKHIEGDKLTSPEATTLEPPDIIPIPQNASQMARSDEARKIGKDAIEAGTVAVVTVAGGLGTRLGANRLIGKVPTSTDIDTNTLQDDVQKT